MQQDLGWVLPLTAVLSLRKHCTRQQYSFVQIDLSNPVMV